MKQVFDLIDAYQDAIQGYIHHTCGVVDLAAARQRLSEYIQQVTKERDELKEKLQASERDFLHADTARLLLIEQRDALKAALTAIVEVHEAWTVGFKAEGGTIAALYAEGRRVLGEVG